jgi:nitrate/nitrite transporter NarK
MDNSFWKAGHRPTLYAAFLYFDLAFMVWVMLGPLGVQIATDLGLTHAQKGMMVATPVLAGAILRIFMGVLVDHLKPKLAGAIGQVIVIVAAVLRLVLRYPQLRADADPRRLPRRRRRLVRRRPAARLALVSA